MELFVTLTTERKAELIDEAAVHHAKLESLEAKKDRDAKAINAEIKAEEEHISRILRVVRGQGENKDQQDLRFDEAGRVTEDAAKQALAAVMARQPECSEKTDQACPVHGTCSCMEEPDPACVLHCEGAPHMIDPPAVEPPMPTEDDEIQATARAFVDSLNGEFPEGLGHTNHLVTGFFAATDVPRKRRGRVRTAIDALLGAAKLPPANAGTSDEPAQEEPEGGNVVEAEA